MNFLSSVIGHRSGQTLSRAYVILKALITLICCFKITFLQYYLDLEAEPLYVTLKLHINLMSHFKAT